MPYDIILGRNDSDKKLFGKSRLIHLGKSYVNTYASWWKQV